jgi:hypothetical protein
MTRPHEVRHRPPCAGPMKPAERVGPWLIARCRGCGATEIRKAETEETTP